MTRYVMRDYFPTLHTLVILLLGVYVTEELPTNYNTMGDQLAYLNEFGYVPDNLVGSVVAAIQSGSQSESFTAAVLAFQQFAQIPPTGVVDSKTKEMMKLPRCGNKDVFPFGKRKKKRYVLHGQKLDHKDLTWKFVTYSSQMDYTTQLEEFKAALRAWSDGSGLTFTQTQNAGTADFRVRFVSGDHGDGHPFDGRGGVLAHAYFPGTVVDTNVHLDEGEIWTKDSQIGHNMRWVAAHEMGHSLGLKHSTEKSALMFPFYKKWKGNTNIVASDDVAAIQSLYGPPTYNYVPSTLAPDAQPNKMMFCNDPSFNTVFTMGDYTYIIHNEFVIRDEQNLQFAAEWPKRTQEVFSSNALTVDAIFEAFGKIYVVQGSGVFVYSTSLAYVAYFGLSSLFEGFQSVDTIFKYGDKYYIIQGDYTFEVVPGQQENDRWTVLTGQRNVDKWGPPAGCSRITAATQWLNDKLYFFCDSLYFRFNPNSGTFDRTVVPDYPRPNNRWWLNCEYGAANLVDPNHKVIGIREPLNRIPEPAGVTTGSAISCHNGGLTFIVLVVLYHMTIYGTIVH